MTTLTQTTTAHPYADEVLAGSSPAVERLRLKISRIAPHFRTALLTGGSGAGKQATALQMHRLSTALDRSFVVAGCADFARNGLPPDTRGTVYLPGLESLPPTLQSGFLHALKSLHRDTRIIVGTQSDVKTMVSTGKLRADLHAAIGTVEIQLPALRDRLADLDAIVPAMLRRLPREPDLSPFALHRLKSYDWPGNFEELWNVCQSLDPAASTITEADLPPLVSVASHPVRTPRLEEVMRRHIVDVLQSCAGNKLRAAELLGISRSTLYRMLSAQT